MKFLIVFALVVVAALAAPLDESKSATILRQENDNIGTDGYKFGFETSDGTLRQEQGTVVQIADDQHELKVQGNAVWYVDGVKYELRYVADKDGFRPEGAHLPVA